MDHGALQQPLILQYDYGNNGSQLAKLKKSRFPSCPYTKIYREEAVGLKSSNYT